MNPHRNQTIDAAKLFLAFGVVFVHLGPSDTPWLNKSFNTVTVPGFIILALYFFIHRISAFAQTPRASFQILQLDRLAVPYVSWTLIYLLLRLVKHHSQQSEFSPDWLQLLLYGGAGVQLYYLPFLLLCQAWLLVFGLIHYRKHIVLAIALICSACLFGHTGASQNYFMFDEAIPRSLLYAALGLILYFAAPENKYQGGTIIIGLIVILLLIALNMLGISATWLRIISGPLAGYAISSVFLALPKLSVSSKICTIALGSSYGIYLIHHGLIEVFEVLAERLGFSLIPYSLSEKILVIPIVCVVCIILAMFIRRSPQLRYLLLGEAYKRRL
ncbi:acyltransferase-like protein [Prosthecobacter fusiformis]|uniref:Acyltransferase-like protein n=1 Tax=Prosthecobacter fusiformis TaxID=48464 RepID=A0A4R7SPJ5_9BACT|nr:acyltransferase family protein [Prosthecobacter fusiformis]TDU80834.1 acyltransferase-like protein [Prosthecobacter fusiformis]